MVLLKSPMPLSANRVLQKSGPVPLSLHRGVKESAPMALSANWDLQKSASKQIYAKLGFAEISFEANFCKTVRAKFFIC